MKTALLATALAVAAISAPAAAVTNPGFETGDLSGWTSFGPASAVTGYSSYSTWAPYAGTYFAALQGQGPGTYSTLSQLVNLAAGETIKGAVGYQTTDYLPFEDDAYLKIDNTTVFTASTATVGDFGNTGWVVWSFTAPTASTYTIELGVRNTLDSVNTPIAFLDSAVPEPQSWALMIAGFGMVGAAMRRRKVALAA